MDKKNPIIAFLLAMFPGAGLLYLKKIRGLFYALAIFGSIGVSFILGVTFYIDFFIVLALIGSSILYLVSIIDTVITAASTFTKKPDEEDAIITSNPESQRFFTIILSFIPGLGHFQLGLVNRGFTLLVGFIGLNVMVFFVAFLSSRDEFLLFLAFSLIIWVYSFFDVMQLLNKKEKGEVLVDKSILEELEENRGVGKKSKAIATFLAIFPGAGHLYLGLQKRGIQLMVAFLLSIYILDVLRLGLFLFLVPIIWFYSFFDGLQKASAYDRDNLEDIPIFKNFLNHQKWVAYGMIGLGVYFILVNVLLPTLAPFLEKHLLMENIRYVFEEYLQTTIVCILLIGGGIKLLSGKKLKSKEEEAE